MVESSGSVRPSLTTYWQGDFGQVTGPLSACFLIQKMKTTLYFSSFLRGFSLVLDVSSPSPHMCRWPVCTYFSHTAHNIWKC